MSEKKNEGFEVKDRRKAREALDNEPGSAAAAAPESGAAKEEGADASASGAGKRGGEESGPGGPPPIDFLSFIGSLAATAFMHLGERIAPDQPETGVNLPAARQMIDLLDMIKAKTAGNLDKQEQDTLDAILYNLRMRFVSQSGSK